VATPNDAGLDEMGDMLSMGGIRFDWMLKRLRDVNSNPWEEIEVDGAD